MSGVSPGVQAQAQAQADSSSLHIRSRIANACDGCKARKIKCDGKLPCGHCARRQRPSACHYSPQRRRQQHQQRKGALGGRKGTAETRDDEGERRSEDGSREMNESRHYGNEPDTRLPRSPPPSERESRRVSRNRAATRNRTRNSASAASTASPETQRSTGRRSSVLHPADVSAEDDPDVPREAGLLPDAQGKLVFIGDCAPLSFFQSVRQLVTSKLGAQNAFAPHTSRFSVLENATAARRNTYPHGQGHQFPEVNPVGIAPVVSAYLSTTSGLVDLFDERRLPDDLLLWANLDRRPDDVTTVVNYLVLAVGCLTDDETLSQEYFEHARDRAFTLLNSDLSMGTVQAFVLITVYMLCSCQMNGAFLFFGTAVRAAYSIGLHRTEVNARFGPEVRRQRDRLWKSLRVVDLFLSTSMGRPPATSDVDSTVAYRTLDAQGNEMLDLLDASSQIMLILERMVIEIYSRRKISLQLTEGISHQLREWSSRWLHPLKEVVADSPAMVRDGNQAEASGACQALASYYYAVMLVSRPFLMYELFRRLSDSSQSLVGTGPSLTSGKSKLADACIDAASLMVDCVLDLIQRGSLPGRRPLLVSWLFASSLVLGVGLLGSFGRVLEKYARRSIQALEHFAAASDTHAKQYALIAESLLTTSLEYLERREIQERLRRTESSSQLFGLIPRESRGGSIAGSSPFYRHAMSSSHTSTPAATGTVIGTAEPRNVETPDRSSFLQYQQQQPGVHQSISSPRLGDIDSAFLDISESLLHTGDGSYWGGALGGGGGGGGAGGADGGFAGSTLNLFPLLEPGGGIDLAHYL